MTKQELVAVINMAYDAADKSKAGPVLFPGKDEQGRTLVNAVGFNTFLRILDTLMPRNISSDVHIKEDKEDWQE